MADSYLLQEDATFLLQEDGVSKIILDEVTASADVSDGSFMLMGFGM